MIALNLPATAQAGRAEISIKGTPTYELVSQRTVGDKVISRYLINITFLNFGNITSEEIEVNLTDAEGFTLTKYFIINSSEEKIITFEWSTYLTTNQNIVVEYFPRDLDTEWTQYNNGIKTFTLKVVDEEDDTSTPGFEIITVIIAMMIFIFYWRRKSKE